MILRQQKNIVPKSQRKRLQKWEKLYLAKSCNLFLPLSTLFNVREIGAELQLFVSSEKEDERG